MPISGADSSHPIHVTVPAIVGICLGTLAGLLTVSVCAYKCYQRRRSARDDHRLASAIRKGLKESNNSQIKKGSAESPTAVIPRNLPSPSEQKTSGSGTGTKETDSLLPDKKVPASSSFHSPIDPGQIKAECYVKDETDKSPSSGKSTPGVQSPSEKDESQKEKEEDKLQRLGTLQFAIKYDQSKTALMVTVSRATDLPPKDPNVASSDPYVKLQLLPEKKHKVKTRVLRKTLNPVYDEIFTFYGITHNQLQHITLHFVILSFDRYSRDDIIGEVVYPLAGLDFEKEELSLCQEIAPRHMKIQSQCRGELLVSLCYQPAANRLTVVVLKARNLPKMDITGLSDPYVKVYLLYGGQRIAKKKTHIKKRTLNPVFNESFLFDVPCNEGLHNISLEFLILDWDRVTKNDVIGRLDIGLKGSGSVEQRHWQEVMNCPRRQLAEWHKLKE